MLEIENDREFKYKGKIWVTQNAYEVIRYIDGRDDDTRLLWDPRISTYYVAEACEHIHRSLVTAGWKNGLYYDLNLKTREDFDTYYGQSDFVYLYYYKEQPFKPNLTGDYGVHYLYDFGVIDSHDILNEVTIKYEDTDLYKILLPRLKKTVKEKTNR